MLIFNYDIPIWWAVNLNATFDRLKVRWLHLEGQKRVQNKKKGMKNNKDK